MQRAALPERNGRSGTFRQAPWRDVLNRQLGFQPEDHRTFCQLRRSPHAPPAQRLLMPAVAITMRCAAHHPVAEPPGRAGNRGCLKGSLRPEKVTSMIRTCPGSGPLGMPSKAVGLRLARAIGTVHLVWQRSTFAVLKADRHTRGGSERRHLHVQHRKGRP